MVLTLLKGDCLEVMAGLSDKSVDCFICDLPYGCLTTPKIGGQANIRLPTNHCAWDVAIDLQAFWTQVKRIRKNDKTPCLMFCTTKFGIDLINSNLKEFRYDLVWDKQRGVSFLTANKMPMRSHEMIYVFSKAGAFYNRVDIDAPGKGKRTDGDSKTMRSDNMFGNGLKRSNGAEKDKACVKTVIQINKVGTIKQGHPTEKPEALYRFLIERYCPADGTILDPTAGSFNSCFTAVALGRKAIGIEKDNKFFNKATKRLLEKS